MDRLVKHLKFEINQIGQFMYFYYHRVLVFARFIITVRIDN